MCYYLVNTVNIKLILNLKLQYVEIQQCEEKLCCLSARDSPVTRCPLLVSQLQYFHSLFIHILILKQIKCNMIIIIIIHLFKCIFKLIYMLVFINELVDVVLTSKVELTCTFENVLKY